MYTGTRRVSAAVVKQIGGGMGETLSTIRGSSDVQAPVKEAGGCVCMPSTYKRARQFFTILCSDDLEKNYDISSIHHKV